MYFRTDPLFFCGEGKAHQHTYLEAVALSGDTLYYDTLPHGVIVPRATMHHKTARWSHPAVPARAVCPLEHFSSFPSTYRAPRDVRHCCSGRPWGTCIMMLEEKIRVRCVTLIIISFFYAFFKSLFFLTIFKQDINKNAIIHVKIYNSINTTSRFILVLKTGHK